jgi:sRNA-binding regulator protein Hfq
MPDGPLEKQVKELESLARARFPDLTAAEIKLVRAASKGEFAVCGPNVNWNDPANDSSEAEGWGPERQIRADLIRWLCVDRRAKKLVDPKGIQVFGAKIPDPLDLDNVTIPFRLALLKCRLMQALSLQDAQMPILVLQGTRVRSVTADRMIVKGSVFLRNGFHAEGEVRLLNARIGGVLDCGGARFENPPQKGREDSGHALTADGAVVKGGVCLNKNFSAKGEVRLLGAQIQGDLSCHGGNFENPVQEEVPESGKALSADGAVIKGSVFLNSFNAEGDMEVRFSAKGEVRFLGARIGGNLACIGATFQNPPKIGVQNSGTALNAERVAVDGHIFLRNGFDATGDVKLLGAQIGGGLDCISSKISGTLIAQTAAIKGTFLYLETDPKEGALDLTDASVVTLEDDVGSWPAAGNLFLDGFVYGRISGGAPKDVTSRLDWLARQEEFAPQPYRQLARVLRDEGNDSGAREVLHEMEVKRRDKEDDTALEHFWSRVLRRTIGYGYYPGRALRWLAWLALAGMILFWAGYCAHLIVPTDKDAYTLFSNGRQLPAQYEKFHASIYSAENSFPLVKLGQIDLWQPDPSPRRFVIRIWNWPHSCPIWIGLAGLLRWFRWIQILLGWVLATFFLAGVTGVVRND